MFCGSGTVSTFFERVIHLSTLGCKGAT